jgi:hypothetical protein
MKLEKIDPQTSYQSLFSEPEIILPATWEDFSEEILIHEIEDYVFDEIVLAELPFAVQRKKIKDLISSLFKIKPLAEEFIPYLAWLMMKYGQSSFSQKFTTLITPSSAIEISERYYRMVVREGLFLNGKDGVDIARLKLQSENQVFDCFYEMRSRVRGVFELKKSGFKIEEEIKATEKKIRDMNQQIKTMRPAIFEVNGQEAMVSRFGDFAEIKRKMEGIKDKIDNTPGLDEVTARKWQAGIELMQPDFDIYMANNYLEQTKSKMKNNVKTWGDEIKVKKEKIKELEEESDFEALMFSRENSLKKVIDKNQIEAEFIKFSTDKEAEGSDSVDTEMISVGAAARLAEAMKSNFPSGFMMNAGAPTGNVAPGAVDAPIVIPDNRPLKPDFDYSNRDKDRLIQLIYSSDDRGIKFEKSAETLEALAYKSPSKAAKILIEQKITDACFYI